VPQYFFHLIYPEGAPVRDDEGLELADDDAAKREAVLSLGDLVKEASSAGSFPFYVSVQIVRQGVGVIALMSGQLSIGH